MFELIADVVKLTTIISHHITFLFLKCSVSGTMSSSLDSEIYYSFFLSQNQKSLSLCKQVTQNGWMKGRKGGREEEERRERRRKEGREGKTGREE